MGHRGRESPLYGGGKRPTKRNASRRKRGGMARYLLEERETSLRTSPADFRGGKTTSSEVGHCEAARGGSFIKETARRGGGTKFAKRTVFPIKKLLRKDIPWRGNVPLKGKTEAGISIQVEEQVGQLQRFKRGEGSLLH